MSSQLSSQDSAASSAQRPLMQQTISSKAASLETRLRHIHAHYRSGQWAQAIAHCEAIIAQCHQHIADSNSADSDSVAAGPNSSAIELHIAKGDLLSGQDKITEAIVAYEQALSLQAQHAARLSKEPPQEELLQKELLQKIERLYGQQAQSAKAKGGATAAVRIYLQALQKHPRLFLAYTRLRYNLMRYEIPAGDPILKEIVQVCQRIVEAEPTILPAQVTLGYALTKAGECEAAIACYRSASDRATYRQIESYAAKQASPTEGDRSAHRPPFSQQPRKPDFMIIGAEKCGTTSLYQYLHQHPDILAPVEKEIDFFDMEYEQGIDWYLAHFPPSFDKQASQQHASQQHATQKQWFTGETSANYLYSNVAPKRVFQHFPDIKLAVILRHPVDRTVSRYNMMVRNGAEKRTFETAVKEEMAILQRAAKRSEDGQTIPWQALNRCRHIGNSLYYYHIQRWLDLFSAQQLLVLRSEDLFSQPEETLAHLYHSLGLSPYTKQNYRKHNSGQYTPADSEICETLSAFFAPHTRKLEALLNRSFDWELENPVLKK